MPLPSKPSILFLDAATVDLGDVDLTRLRKQGQYSALALGPGDPLPALAREAEVLISNKFPLREAQFPKLPRLRLICVAATGTNNVDLEAARARGIAVCNVAGYSTPTVVEHALMFLLALSHRLHEQDAAVKRGEWSRGPYFALLNHPYSDLAKKTLGIVGYGALGRRVARLARALGMRVLVAKIPGRRYSRKGSRIPLTALLRRSDFISLHCPLSLQTQGLIDAKALAQMKPGAGLLNLARGPIVVEAAVAKALRAGKLAGYASDVLTEEPPPKHHPLLAAGLRDKVLLTPHIAWASRESRQRLVNEIAENIRSFCRGRRRNRIV
jgi:glycerate dehydrogenase